MSVEKEHNDRMLEYGTALLEKGHRIRIKNSLDHSGNFRDPENVAELSSFAEAATKKNRKISIYYDLRFVPGDLHQAVCIDIDQGLLWECVSESLGTKQEGEFLMNPSKRGGHIVGFVPGSPGAYKKGIRVTLQCSAAADFLTDHVCLLGAEERSITNLPPIRDLGTIPLALLPHFKRKTTPVITETGLPEGTRDDSMYRIAKNLNIPVKERAEVLYFTNRTFCKPPLEDEVVEKFVHQEPHSTDPVGGAANAKLSNREVVVQLRNDREALERGLAGKYRYHRVHKQWYAYTGTHWVATSDELLLVTALEAVDDHIEDYLCKYSVQKRKGLVKSLLNDLEGKLFFSEETLSKRHFTSWRNGLLDFRERALIGHTQDVFVRHYIDQDYYPEEDLSDVSKNFLVEITQGNPLYMMAIRLLFHNALWQPDNVQIITLFYGAHGVGKSVIANFLSSFFGTASLAVSMSNFSSAFAKHSIIQADLLVINELTGVTNKECQSLKSMVGHDAINMEVKFKQGVTSAPVRGIWVATSNQEPEDIAGADVALRDRLLSIECSPRVGAGDSFLPAKLKRNRSGWVNWSSRFHPEVLRLTVRAGAFNTLLNGYKDPLVIYISQCIQVDPKGFVWARNLGINYAGFCIRKGWNENLNGVAIKISIIKHLRSLFLLRVPEGRRIDPETGSKLSCIFGIKLIDPDREVGIGMPRNEHEGLFKRESLFDQETGTFARYASIADPSLPSPTVLVALPPGRPDAVVAESPGEADPVIYETSGSASPGQEAMGTGYLGLQPSRAAEGYTGSMSTDQTPLPSPGERGPTKPQSVAIEQKPTKGSKDKVKDSRPIIPMIWDDVMIGQSPKFVGIEEYSAEYSLEYPLGMLGDKRLTDPQRRKKGIPTTDQVLQAAAGISLKPYSESQVSKAFGSSYAFFRDYMTKPLSDLPKPHLSEYSPHKPNCLALTMSERVNLVRRTGVAANLLELGLKNTKDIWAVTLGKLRALYPTDAKLSQEKRDSGRLFPYEYHFDVDGCHRYKAYPPHTTRDEKGIFKLEMLYTLGSLTKLNFFDIDMSACHARVILAVREEKDRPFITQACMNSDTWLDLAREFLRQHPQFAPLGLKKVRKCLKIYSLAQLNGAALQSPHNLSGLLSGTCEDGSPEDSFKNAFARALSVKSYVRECNGHGAWLCREGHIYSLFKEGKLYPRKVGKSKNADKGAKGVHTLSSVVLCGMETYMLSLVIEYLGTVSAKVVPIVLMHDGMVVAAEESTKMPQIEAILNGFKLFSIERFGYDLGLEVTDLNNG